ncbi:cysteine and histidine-rich domain-containing protein RAR1 [Tanacetum coccineum]
MLDGSCWSAGVPNLVFYTCLGAQVKNSISKPSNQVQSTSEEGNSDLQQSVKALPKKIVDINQPQICKNKGCGQTFKEIDNHETACNHHPGPAVFHDRLRGWKCCDIHVKEFDEFMTIPPCAKGWHNADAASKHLEEIHVTWDHLKKKQTRLRTYTMPLDELRKQSVETASPTSSDAVVIYEETTSGFSRRCLNEPTKETLEDSYG